MLADQFLDHFDGFSIGSNDMTQLTLGLEGTPVWSLQASTSGTQP